ncbi:MAG: DUF1302 domain-containing protein, partial [Deltaproteobacteria bacterium]|nr:DUF1302 domain-containing protein [Deltaproteobacteria bacterium]
LKWWWDKSTAFDDELKRSIPTRGRRDHVRPRHFDDDMLTEAYVDIINGPLQLRVGKQIVIWGQLDMQRVADVVNPLDLRKGVPGVDTWEEIKQGVWMVRGYYQSDLPGNLLFEAIFNPGDFREMLLPEDGTHYGTLVHESVFDPSNKFGMGHWILEKMKRDAPGFTLGNYEYGFKVRGYCWNIDWTLMYYNSLSDTPVAHPDRNGRLALAYVLPAIQGRAAPDWPDYKVFYYKRTQNIGGTAQVYIHNLWRSVWRLEWAYQIGVPMNKGTDGSSTGTYGWTRRDAFAFAVACSKSITIPGFTQSFLATGRQLDLTITYAWDKVLNHDHDLVLGSSGHAYDHSVNDQVSMFLMQDFFHSTFMFICNGYYHFHTGKWMVVPTVTYMFPGDHWRADVGYAAFGGAKA